jgi:hypothetical protein
LSACPLLAFKVSRLPPAKKVVPLTTAAWAPWIVAETTPEAQVSAFTKNRQLAQENPAA